MMLMAGKYKLVSVCQRSGTNNVLFSGFFINFYIIDFSVPILIINFFFMILFNIHLENFTYRVVLLDS